MKETPAQANMPEKTADYIDPVTGVATTQHSWDGISELNNPLPRWWLWMFILTHVWAFGYWIAYPSWPLVASYTKGVLNWSSRDSVATELDNLKQLRAPTSSRLAQASLEEIRADPQLMTFALAQGRVAFADNCAPCHGQGGGGAPGYPNLNDDDWLWGGSLQQIEYTIRYGARSTHDKAHVGNMPAFGRDGALKRSEVEAVAHYVRTLAGLPPGVGAEAVTLGAKVYADNCSACHGEKGAGNQEAGAPNLTDGIWLYGADTATIIESISNGRGSVMPAWNDRLDDPTIKALTAFVHSLGGGR